jgi:cytochrome P450
LLSDLARKNSDTTAATLSNCFYYLARYPETYKRLQQETDKVFPGGDKDWNYTRIANLPYLDAIINETLRLKPAVPSGVQRETPVVGIDIDELHIPGKVLVRVPLYAVSRDSRYFERPEEFLPERWLQDSAMKTDKSAYAPFLIGKLFCFLMNRGVFEESADPSPGAYSCVGKNLAIMQLRSVLSRTVLMFNLSFAPGEDGEKFAIEDLDTFTLTVPKLTVVLTERRM